MSNCRGFLTGSHEKFYMSIIVKPSATMPTKIVIYGVRIGYANGLNEARVSVAAKADAKPQFSSVFFVPETDAAVQGIQAAMWAAVSAKFGDKAALKWAQIQANNKLPLKSGNLKADKEGYAGNLYLSANAKAESPPKLLDIYEDAPGSGRPMVLKRPQNRIYSGCYVNLEVNFWVYTSGAEGVGCDLLLVQFAADGERFAGGAAQADESAFGAQAAPTAAIGAPAFGAAPAAPAFAAPAAPAFAAPAAPAFAAPAAPAFAAPVAPAAPAFATPAAPAFAVPPVPGL